MAERQITASNLPVVTPPWLQNTESPTQNPGQQTPQPQNNNPSMPKADTDYLGLAGKLFGKTAFNAAKPFFAAGGAATGISGAASGGITAGGGSYVTGSGLAGSASAINTTAGAAGSLNGAGAISKGLGGLASAGIGLATVAIGNNYFGGEGGTGAAIGTAIGSLWGPAGAAIGGLFGGAIGGIFGGDGERAYVGVVQGGGAQNKANKFQTGYKTALGNVIVATDNLPDESREQIGKIFKDTDAKVAALFNESQLERVKNGVLNAPTSNQNTSWGESGKSERANSVISSAMKDRYAAAVGGLDPNYYGTFQRVADAKNMSGLIDALAQMDREIKNGSGAFSEFSPKPQAQLIKDNDPRLQPTITTQVRGAGANWQSTEKVVANPKYDAKLAQQYKQQQADRQKVGWEPYKTTEKVASAMPQFSNQTVSKSKAIYEDGRSAVGDQALSYLAEQYGIGARPVEPKYKSAPINQPEFGGKKLVWDSTESDNKALRDSYNKKLGAWEKQVLDTYADQNMQSRAAESVGNNTITRELTVQAEQSVGRTQLFGDIQQQEVKLNRATPQNNNATNAGLLQRGGLI